MTLEEYFEKSDRKGIEALLLWCVKELHGEGSWLYGVYSQKMDKVSVNNMKAIIEVQTSNMIPSVVNGIIDVFAGMYCKKECDIMEMDFYNDFATLENNKQQYLIEALQRFVQGINGNIVFINDVRSVLVERRYHTFDKVALRMIHYLEYVAENDKGKLKDLYIKMKDIMNCKKTF